ncbi:MAG: S41 family peptidase [Firmicutes bacterium]|nr:S41 family peptidase [Bacillota bacterium]
MKRITCLALVCIIVVTMVTACGRNVDGEPLYETQYERLAKLGKVWGFAKYTHHGFISGRLDWDAELLNLVPGVYNAEDVNGILYDWFVGLGEDGYDFEFGHDFDLANNMAAHAEDGRPMADLSWINYDYLGPLAAHLLRFNGVSLMDRAAAPVFFNPSSTPNFSNQHLHVNVDFSDPGYRLLGLFRLWNAMKYYFPHLDVLDVAWNDLLAEFIPKMLEGTDRLSYELILAAMTHYLHDAHVQFVGTTFFSDRFGRYVVPVQLISAEGRPVVYRNAFRAGIDGQLTRGDVILSVDNRCIEEVTAEMRPFLSYPNEEKALAYLSIRWSDRLFPHMHHILRSHEPDMEIHILRSGVEMTLNIAGTSAWADFFPRVTESHVLLENNIGLINPSISGDVRSIMESFADTDGIIIDLRQRPVGMFWLEMWQYLMAEPLPFAYISRPSHTHPGARVDILVNQYLPPCPYAFVYDRPVVLLMDEQTFSHPEWAIMSFRVASNVTVIGPYSMGSNGNITSLPLPGGITMWFTSLGVYTPEGGQTHRIGLAPDIRVDRTIAGIAEGRDELMEAAIRYIRER